MKIYCPQCKLNKSPDEFGPNKASRNGKQVYCTVCRREYQKKDFKLNPKTRNRVKSYVLKRRAKNLLFLQNYCKQHPCVVCGEDDFDVLDFDHIGEKYKGISRLMLDENLEAIKKELVKCQVLCANCHRRKTAKQLGYYKYISLLSEDAICEIKKELGFKEEKDEEVPETLQE